MPDIRFISYLKTLKPEDWDKMVTPQWTVKDVIAHMVGWERTDVDVIKQSWETKTPPWWKNKNEDDAFNAKWVAYYKDYSPEQLIAEWETWQQKVLAVMDTIGSENLRAHPELFDWLFEGLDDNRSNGKESHHKHHYEQIKKAVGNTDAECVEWAMALVGAPATATKVLSSEKNTVYKITSGAATYFLKISANLKPEKDRLDWLQGKLPAPQVVSFTNIAGRDALVMTAVRGENLASLAQAWGAEKVITKLVAALHRFHATDATECPFGGPGEGSVLVHGDACLPNFIYHGEELSGYIDLGDMAVGSVEVDLSAAVWTLKYNFGNGYGLKFLQEYGIENATEEMADELRQRYEDKI